MKLAHYQIEHIAAYVSSQRIHYTDIRHELTDHIASAVEHKMEQDQCSFGDAFSESIEEVNCFGIQKKKLINDTLSAWKTIVKRAFNLLKGSNLVLLLVISALTSFCYLTLGETGTLDNWFSTILKIVIVLPVIVCLLDRKVRPYKYSYFMTSVVGLYLLVEIITATKTFVVDNLIVHQPALQIIYFSVSFFVAMVGYRFVSQSYKRVKNHSFQ